MNIKEGRKKGTGYNTRTDEYSRHDKGLLYCDVYVEWIEDIVKKLKTKQNAHEQNN